MDHLPVVTLARAPRGSCPAGARRLGVGGGALLLPVLLGLSCSPTHLAASAIIHPLRVPIVGDAPEAHRVVTIETADGLGLDGWLFPVARPRGLVALVHGKDINRQHLSFAAGRFVALGYAVLAYDQRAHGRSQGTVTTYGAKEVGDLRRALDVALGALSVDGPKAVPVFLVGESLGAAVVLQTAAVEPRVSAVVAAASFADVRSVVSDRTPWFVSDRLRDAALVEASTEGGFEVDAVSVVRAAADISVPVLLLHGSEDAYVPMRHSLRIAAALRPSSRRLVVLEGVGHTDVLQHERVWTEIERFIVAHTSP